MSYGHVRHVRSVVSVVVGGVLALLFTSLTPARAAGIHVQDEASRRVNAALSLQALDENLFGDSVNGYTNTVTFSVTDIDLPGNNALPVSVARTHAVGGHAQSTIGLFGEWEMDLPHLYGLFASSQGWAVSTSDGTKRCSTPTSAATATPKTAPSAQGAQVASFTGAEYWSGNRMHIPGQGDRAVLLATTPLSERPGGTGSHRWTTTDKWYFSCIPAKNTSGEGFLAVAPNGVKYYFDHFVARPYDVLEKTAVYAGKQYNVWVQRSRMMVYASRMEDIHGNRVDYQWSGAALMAIRSTGAGTPSSDDRTITFKHLVEYNWPKITEASDGTRTWKYQYVLGMLKSVELPDETRWLLETRPGAVNYGLIGQAGLDGCTRDPVAKNERYIYLFTHPSGAVGQFDFKAVRHTRARVSPTCSWDTKTLQDRNGSPGTFFDTLSLVWKRLSGPAIDARSWAYGVSTPAGSWASCGSCATTKTTTTTDSAGRFTRNTYSIHFGVSEGTLLKQETGESASAIRSTSDNRYATTAEGAAGFVANVGVAGTYRGQDPMDSLVVPLREASTTREGQTFKATVTQFDWTASPRVTVRGSTLGYSRTDTVEYLHDTARWVLGLEQRRLADGIEVARSDYNAQLLPEHVHEFGLRQQTFAYHAGGMVASARDGRDLTTAFKDWYRGTPRLVEFAGGATKTAEVANPGWILSVTDEAKARTCYAYDRLGRVELVTHTTEQAGIVGCSDERWSPTVITFAKSAAEKYGMPAGHWVRTERTGNAEKRTYLDALWRPIVEEAEDAIDPAATNSWVAKRYDAFGRPAFTSYPRNGRTAGAGASWAAVNDGTHQAYDVLNRPLQVAQDSEAGQRLITRIDYPVGFQRKTTNPRDQVTTEQFQAYDVPSYELPTLIDSPEGVRTTIRRDAFGKPLEVSRGPRS